LGASNVTWNFGRLYSSTFSDVSPGASPSTRIVIRPISRSRGAVKLPLNEPKSFVRCCWRAISWPLTS